MKPCRVVGCVALVDDAWPSRLMDTRLVGVCAVHQQFPADELRDLVSRESGGVPRRRRVDVGICYQRADGTEYYVGDDGRCHEIEVGKPHPAYRKPLVTPGQRKQGQ